MAQGKKIAALIVAGGEGLRLGSEIPKQYLTLQGLPVLRRSVEAFKNHPLVSRVLVVIHPAHQDLYRQATAALDLPPPVFGGATRQESVRKGLAALRAEAPDIVLIHDAARPLVPGALITSICRAAEENAAVIPGLALSDTVKRDESGMLSTVTRHNLYAVQTPQAFSFSLIDRLHEKHGDKQVTDDAGLVEAEGLPVRIVPGARENIKITAPADMEEARRRLLAQLADVRTGFGYDVHRLVKDSARKLMICGVEVAHPYALEGHSDADVGLHAITDAILGTLCDGDIGAHFNPKDARWKDADSALFLRDAAEKISARGGMIAHVDVTLVCETPKIGPYRDAMRARIAEILGISISCISVKATTTEGLGFAGRGEGIAAQCVITARFPLETA